MKRFLTGAAMLMLAGCSQSYGTKIDAAQLSALAIGQTRLGDVEDRFGPPTGTTLSSDGTTTLAYTYIPPNKDDVFFILESVPKDDTDRRQTAALVFTADGILKSQTLTIAPAAPAPARQP